jgi:two-component system phosphate regulon sensor histidine kinase PhoR
MIGTNVLALFVVLALAALFSAVVTRPLRQMATECHRLVAEGKELSLPIHRNDEIGEVALALHHLATQINRRLADANEAQERAQALLDHLDCGVLLVDGHRRVICTNPAVFRILGQEPRAAQAHDLVELVRSADLVAAVNRILARGGQESGEIVLFAPERKLTVSYIVTALETSQTAPRGALVQLRDITEAKRLEAVRHDFVTNASHELKTPLAAIVGYTETLLAGWSKMPAEQRMRYLRRIREQAQRLEFLTSDLLTLAESEEKIVLTLVPYPVHRLLQSVAGEFASKAAEKGITLKVTAAKGIKALMDPDRMHIVLSNLVDNAIKYTHQGGSVTLRAQALPSGEIVVEVADTGMGIDPKYHERIFERFYRVDKSRSRALGGTGLGLAIVKHIVEQHGSQVRLESELGKGSRFWFSLQAA